MGKVIVLPEKSKTCIICGCDLPPGRSRKCFGCLPRRRRHKSAPLDFDLPQSPEYTTADIVALARSYGLSYGQYVAILNDPKATLPPRLRPVVWPIGSDHGDK